MLTFPLWHHEEELFFVSLNPFFIWERLMPFSCEWWIIAHQSFKSSIKGPGDYLGDYLLKVLEIIFSSSKIHFRILQPLLIVINVRTQNSINTKSLNIWLRRLVASQHVLTVSSSLSIKCSWWWRSSSRKYVTVLTASVLVLHLMSRLENKTSCSHSHMYWCLSIFSLYKYIYML